MRLALARGIYVTKTAPQIAVFLPCDLQCGALGVTSVGSTIVGVPVLTML